MYLQLAENDRGIEETPYIFIPGQGYVREDHFDNLSNLQWKNLMNKLAPYQVNVRTGGMSENEFLLSKSAKKTARQAKKAEKKKVKQETKKGKKEAKVEKKKAKVEIKKAKADLKKSKADVNRERAEQGLPPLTPGKDIFKNIISTAGKFLPGGGGGGVPEETEYQQEIVKTEKQEAEKKPFYKNPWVIGTGVVLLAGGIYLVARPKRKPVPLSRRRK